MRRRLAERVLRGMDPGRFLEAGCGWGELLPTLVDLGYTGVAVEPSDEARSIAQTRTEHLRDRVNVFPTLGGLGTSEFDYVLAFEVLEHLEDDTREFQRWTSRLRIGGKSIISVPAHENHWTASDLAVGHVRRYSAAALHRLHESAGMRVLELWSYGFPVMSVTRHIRGLVSKQPVTTTMSERTLDSAFVSHQTITANGVLASSVARGIGAIADLLQRPFLKTEWGDGFFVIAIKD